MGLPDNLRHAQYRSNATQIDDPQKLVDELTGGGGGGSGTLTNFSFINANGIVGTVTNPTTEPTLELELTNIQVTSLTVTENITIQGDTIHESDVTVQGSISATNISGTNTGDQVIELTGDVTGSGTGTFVATLANTAVTPGSYTLANISVDAKGRIIAAANGSAGTGSVTSVSVVSANGFSGSVADATTTPAITILADDTGVVAGTYTGATITVDAKGRVTSAQSGGGLPSIPADFKDNVDIATTANITLSGEQTIDGVLTSSSRVLVKNQTTASQNGIYVSAAGAWSRSTDADTSAEVTSGLMVYCSQGTVSAGLVYLLTTVGTITLGTTNLTFVAIQLPFSFFVNTTVAGTTYTHVLTDSGKRLNFTNAATKTFTVAPQNTVNSAANTEIEVFNAGAGLLTIAPGSGVTINSLDGILTVRQYQLVKLKKRANPNTWDVTGIIPVQPFDVYTFYPGVPTASAKVLRASVGRAATFAANFSGSYATAVTAATASTVFDVQKNGSSIGSVTFAISGTTGTFASSGGAAQSFAAGDVLAIIAPGTPDATLADINFTLLGVR